MESPEPSPATHSPAPSAWISISSGEFDFPPNCTGCCAPTTDRVKITSDVNLLIEIVDVALLLFSSVKFGDRVELAIPLCRECRRGLRRRWARSMAVWALLLAGAVVAGFAWLKIYPDNSPLWWLCVAVVLLIAWSVSRPAVPVAARNFSSKRSTVELRFQNPAYELLMNRRRTPDVPN